MEHLANNHKRKGEYMSRRRADPVHRNFGQAADMEQRSNRRTDPEYRIQVQSYIRVRRANACTK